MVIYSLLEEVQQHPSLFQRDLYDSEYVQRELAKGKNGNRFAMLAMK